MSKTLYICRHSEAGWGAGVEDFQRRLTQDGRNMAHQMGKWLAEEDNIPELVLCSSAKRTQETLEEFMEGAGAVFSEIEFKDELYYNGEEQILDQLVCNVSDDVSSVMLIGHEPKCSYLVFRLTRRECVFLPASIAKITFDVEKWSDIKSCIGSLDSFKQPK